MHFEVFGMKRFHIKSRHKHWRCKEKSRCYAWNQACGPLPCVAFRGFKRAKLQRKSLFSNTDKEADLFEGEFVGPPGPACCKFNVSECSFSKALVLYIFDDAKPS